MTVFMKCPRCNLYMTPDLSYTALTWRCSCGYSSDNTSYVINDNSIKINIDDRVNKMRTKQEYQEVLDSIKKTTYYYGYDEIKVNIFDKKDKRFDLLQELIDNLKDNEDD